ncbi:gdsl lipase acylhydrolase family protein [Nannochloropsis gaditana]|uniref:Gdsl lipase acylhydrolase family protein n=1 Tax=Nannochloropsis gaditana TaxID=72520 RepID=W7U3M7_9STRA|nr:gdsl lipase acylhydrolase family protein [Nannochloropsis gaditana]
MASSMSSRSAIAVPPTSYISIRRSSLLLITLGSFALGTLIANMTSRSWRRVQRYIDSRRSNGGRRPVIVCFGDSITQGGHSPEHVGWVGRLEDFYCRKADVLNRGFSGYNTDWLSRMLVDLFSRMFRRRPPVLVTIWLGANDATVESSRQHVPLWKYKENLEKMVRFFKGLGRRDRQVAILLVTPPPLHEGKWLAFLRSSCPTSLLDRSFARTASYALAAREVGQAIKVPVVDIHSSFGVQIEEAVGGEGMPQDETYASFLSDGLHLNEKGNRRAFEAVRDSIKHHFPWLDPINLETQAPGWESLRSLYLDEAEGRGEKGEGGTVPLYSSKSSVIFNAY